MRWQARRFIGRNELHLDSLKRHTKTWRRDWGKQVADLATVEICPLAAGPIDTGRACLFSPRFLFLIGGSYSLAAVLADYNFLECGFRQSRVKMRVCAVIITHLIRFYYSLNPPAPQAAIVTELSIREKTSKSSMYVLTAVTNCPLELGGAGRSTDKKESRMRGLSVSIRQVTEFSTRQCQKVGVYVSLVKTQEHRYTALD